MFYKVSRVVTGVDGLYHSYVSCGGEETPVGTGNDAGRLLREAEDYAQKPVRSL